VPDSVGIVIEGDAILGDGMHGRTHECLERHWGRHRRSPGQSGVRLTLSTSIHSFAAQRNDPGDCRGAGAERRRSHTAQVPNGAGPELRKCQSAQVPNGAGPELRKCQSAQVPNGAPPILRNGELRGIGSKGGALDSVGSSPDCSVAGRAALARAAAAARGAAAVATAAGLFLGGRSAGDVGVVLHGSSSWMS